MPIVIIKNNNKITVSRKK